MLIALSAWDQSRSDGCLQQSLIVARNSSYENVEYLFLQTTFVQQHTWTRLLIISHALIRGNIPLFDNLKKARSLEQRPWKYSILAIDSVPDKLNQAALELQVQLLDSTTIKCMGYLIVF